jgi:hypothetical protein
MKTRLQLLVLLCLLVIAPGIRGQEETDREQCGRDIFVPAGETAGDVLCFYCSIHVRGTVSGDAIALGGGIEIDGTVAGDAVAAGGGIRLGPGAKVGGDAVAAGGRLERGAQASVGGDAESKAWFYLPGQRHLFLRSSLLFAVVNVGLLLVAALVLRRRRVAVIADTIRQHPLWALLVGAGVLLLATILFVASARVGWAAAVLDTVVCVALGVILAAGYAGLAFWLGRGLPRVAGLLKAVLLGGLLLIIAQLVPILGLFAFLAALLLAAGCAVFSGFGHSVDWLPSRLRRRRAAVQKPPTGAGPTLP